MSERDREILRESSIFRFLSRKRTMVSPRWYLSQACKWISYVVFNRRNVLCVALCHFCCGRLIWHMNGTSIGCWDCWDTLAAAQKSIAVIDFYFFHTHTERQAQSVSEVNNISMGEWIKSTQSNRLIYLRRKKWDEKSEKYKAHVALRVWAPSKTLNFYRKINAE